MTQFESEARLSFSEATSIIIGHGVGSGILAVPYLASRNRFWDFLWIVGLVYILNLALHFMVAELSYNNSGAQFLKCFENELFRGRFRKPAIYISLAMLIFTVVMNVSGYILGAAAVFSSWFGLAKPFGMLLYYAVAGSIVLVGMKLVGICEKYSVIAMGGVIGILLAATLLSETSPLPFAFHSASNLLALFSIVSFSLSAVMSVPQIVKGLNGDVRKIRRSIMAGTGINTGLILLVTLTTLLGAGSSISNDGALVDLSAHLGGWVSIVGYIFTLLALSTSFWANTLNVRDIIHEQFKLNRRRSWLIASVPSLLIALTGFSSFVGFVRLAGVVQIVTGIGIIISYARSRRRSKESPICGPLGSQLFRFLCIASAILASLGAVLPVA